MKKLFVLMNHIILPEQIKQAKEILDASEVVILSDDAWAMINPYDDTIAEDLLPYKKKLSFESHERDYLLVQGDFGATYHMVRFALMCKLIPIYATTRRHVDEKVIDGKVVTTREFSHIRFRRYEEV